MSSTLYYIHDPMCSWCWAFQPVLRQIIEALPESVTYQRVLGGLAPDTDQAMEPAMRERLIDTWQRIENTVPGTRFNFDFWSRCTPRRSTYPACRAVLAARAQGREFDALMTQAIQQAYYRQARNPSDDDTLLQLAEEIGLDSRQFETAFTHPDTQQALEAEIAFAQSLGAESFPSLVFEKAHSRWPIPIDYKHAEVSLEVLEFLTDKD